jgi:hypothetical protein
MSSRKLPAGARVYENDRFKIPDGWITDDEGRTFVKNSGEFTMTATRGATYDDWSFKVENAGVFGDRPIEGIASSRLAVMRKAELAVWGVTRRA